MATGALPDSAANRSSRNLIVIGLLAVAAAAVVRFIWHYAAPYFLNYGVQQFDQYGYWPHRFRLITHISGGIVALTCGTLQLWTGLRQKAMNFHRWIGRIYLAGGAVGMTGAFLMAVFTKPRSFGVSLSALATAWIVTTGIAWAAILRGRVELHKEWMLRSYIVAFAFVTFRLMTDNMPWLMARIGSNPDDALTSVGWLSWVVPLAVYEVILQSRRVFAKQTA